MRADRPTSWHEAAHPRGMKMPYLFGRIDGVITAEQAGQEVPW